MGGNITAASGSADNFNKQIAAYRFIQHEEDAILNGEHYFIEDYTTQLSSTQYFRIQITTPGTSIKTALVWGLRTDGVMEVELLEDAVGGMAGGSTYIPFNSDRNSTNVASAVVVTGVSSSTGYGAILHRKRIGSTGFKDVSGGDIKLGSEIILKSNTVYLKTFKPVTDVNTVSYVLYFHEEKA